MSPSTSSDYPSSPTGNDSVSQTPIQIPSLNGSSGSSSANGKFAKALPERSQSQFPANSRSGFIWERWALIALLLLGGGYGLWQWLGPKTQAGPGGPGGGPPADIQGPPPRPVVTTLLRAGIAGEQIRLLGQVESGDATILRSQAEGVIEELLVIAGDKIARGDVIAILDDMDQRLALAEAEAELQEAKADLIGAQAELTEIKAELAEADSNLAELKQGSRRSVIEQRRAAVEAAKAQEAAARDNLTRIQNLAQEGAVAERLLVEAQTGIDGMRSDRLAAEANLEDAQAGPRRDELAAEAAKVTAGQAAVAAQEAAISAQEATVAAQEAVMEQAVLALQRNKIIATAPGIVNDMLVNRGDYVRSADSILELVDNSVVDILLELPEARASQIQPGQPVVLSSRALPGLPIETAIDSLTPIASATSRSRAARIRLSNPPPGLLPGTALVADLKLSSSSDGYQVSRDVLTRRSGEWLVYAIEAGGDGPAMAQEIPIELVSDNGESVIIDSPELQPNLEIVLKGGDALRHEAPVMVVEGPSAGPPIGSTEDGATASDEGA